MEQKIANIIYDVLRSTDNLIKLSDITPEKFVSADLGADSLDRVSIVINVERQFNIALPVKFSNEDYTVASLIAAAQKAVPKE